MPCRRCAAIARLLAPQGCAVFLFERHPVVVAARTAGQEWHACRCSIRKKALWNQVKPERALGCVVLCPATSSRRRDLQRGPTLRW